MFDWASDGHLISGLSDSFLAGDHTVAFNITMDDLSGIRDYVGTRSTISPVGNTGFVIRNNATPVFNWSTNNGSSVTTLTGSLTMTIGQQYHFACVRGGTSKTLYKDGASLGSQTHSGSFSAGRTLEIAGITDSTTRRINGRMTEIGIWSVALTTDECLALSNGFPPSIIRPSSLVLYVPCLRNIHDLKGGTLTQSGNAPAVVPHTRRMPVN